MREGVASKLRLKFGADEIEVEGTEGFIDRCLASFLARLGAGIRADVPRQTRQPRDPMAPKRRFTEPKALRPHDVLPLSKEHGAIIASRTLFPSTVVDPADSPRLLVSGQNSRKIGDRVSKGPWKGFPVYTLTLEERASCPESCARWLDCYGNAMPRARRHRHGAALEDRLRSEVAAMAREHSGGFVVRLHILGDFYSVGYVNLWLQLIAQHRSLHVYGYTAWSVDSVIGRAVANLRDARWDRFAVRTSVGKIEKPGTWATALDFVPENPTVVIGNQRAVVCPMQTGATECCGTCGLCWSKNAKDTPIAFVLHGKRGGRHSAVAA